MAQQNVGVLDLTKRFGVTSGTAQLVNTSGTTILYTPALGKKIRLTWIGLAAPDYNTSTVIAQIKIGSTLIYWWPLPSPGVFMHSSVREGAINEALSITLSVQQEVYVCIDIEEFY